MQNDYFKFKYGFFVHYIAEHAIYADGRKAENIDECADGFDVRDFADSLEKMKVEYLIFTAWHFAAKPLYPSAVTERYRPGCSARRDLVGEMIDAVRAKGIKVYLYTHPRDGHDFDDISRLATGWGLGSYENEAGTPNPENFNLTLWNQYTLELYSELLSRYGSRIEGLFIDGCGPTEHSRTVVDYLMLRRIIKQTNPNLLMMQNFFCDNFGTDSGMQEGFFEWERRNLTVERWPAMRRGLAFVPFSGGWSAGTPRGEDARTMKAEEMAKYTVFNASCTEGGGTCWASGPYCGGGWPDGVAESMALVGNIYEKLGESVKNTIKSPSRPTVSGDTLETKNFVFFTTSRDKTFEYMHIMKVPASGKIELPPAEDGALLKNPIALTGKVSASLSSENGRTTVTLSGEPDALDTVIRFERKGGHAPEYEWINNDDNRICYRRWDYKLLMGDGYIGSAYSERCHGCYESDIHFSKQKGAEFFLTLEGKAVEIYGTTSTEGGKADVFIDKIKVGEINQCAETRETRKLQFTYGPILGGRHVLRIVLTEDKIFELDAIRVIK